MARNDHPFLVTGFNPFGGSDRNPSQAVVEALTTETGVVTEVLRTEFAYAGRRVRELLQLHAPSVWIGLGLSERAAAITLERLAFNLDDARIADNIGDRRSKHLIQPRGLPVRQATLPLANLRDQLLQQKIPAVLSDSAGRFVCNHVFYTALSTIADAAGKTIGGFIHLPWPADWKTAGKAAHHGLTLATMVHAVRICIQCSIRDPALAGVAADM